VRVEFGVLGPVAAWDGTGAAIELKGPRHRAVLARLVIARGQVVPVDRLVDDLWADPPAGAVSAVRTFVAALRRGLEPARLPRHPARLLVTDGPGYALRCEPDAVDAWRFEAALSQARTAPAQRAFDLVDRGLALWRGPALAGFEDEPWARGEHARLEALRLAAVERRAESLIDLGRGAEAVADLHAHAAEHPWREESWRLLALALDRSGRRLEALEVARGAVAMLGERFGLDPGPRLRRLETDLLRGTGQAEAAPESNRIWAEAAATYDKAVSSGVGARLESTVALLRDVALTGAAGLEAVRAQRLAPIAAAERSGDPDLTARVIGAYDVPAVWTRSDDPALAAQVVAAAERALPRLPDGAARARLLAVIAVESRGTGDARSRWAAVEAERIARGLGDPRLLAFALNGRFMQAFERTGLAPERDAIGAELVELARLHDLPAYAILGHLIRVQALGGLGDFTGADEHASMGDALAERHDRPLVAVFTGWYRAMVTAAAGAPIAEAEAAYRRAAALLGATGMPGVERGLLPLALLCLRIRHGAPLDLDSGTDWGPYEPWVRPLMLMLMRRRDEAAAALKRVPEPPHDLLAEALWCVTAAAAIALDDHEAMGRARDALAPASAEIAGAGSGMLTAGPVAEHLRRLDSAMRRTGRMRALYQ